MPKNRNWIWFFITVGLLGAAAVSINWAFNARQQLTSDRLVKAEDLWDKAGPTNYDLVIDKTIQSAAADDVIKDRIVVQVRNKKVVEASINDRPLERRLWDDYDVPGWFGFVERFLKIDEAPNAPRTFRAAVFDPVTGQLQHFRRHVSGGHERQELVLTLTVPK